MNPYIGDRQLEPDDEPEVCELCGGSGEVYSGHHSYEGYYQPPEPIMDKCPECDGEGKYDTDPGEPNEDPE